MSGFGMAADDQPARYVQRGGEVVYRHPFLAEGVRMYGFVLEAHHANLTRAMYRTFTEPSDGEVEVEPLGRFVVLAFMATESFRASEAPDDALGVVPELEAAIWVPVQDKTTGERYWTLPYMYVDRAAAMAAGRETYGFPKQVGEIMIDGTDPPRSLLARVSTINTFGPKASVTDEDVISVTRPSLAQASSVQWADATTMCHEFVADSATARGVPAAGGRLQSLVATGLSAVQGSSRALADAPEVAALLLEGFLEGRLPVLLLKQFRSCEDPDAACYQAIVNANFVIKASRGAGRLPDDYVVDLAMLAGSPLVADLGLPTQSQPTVAFTLDFDFEIQRGSVLWSTSRPGR